MNAKDKIILGALAGYLMLNPINANAKDYDLQTGSFLNKKYAINEQNRLKKHGLETIVESNDGKYCVIIDSNLDYPNAIKKGKNLKKSGKISDFFPIESKVDKKPNRKPNVKANIDLSKLSEKDFLDVVVPYMKREHDPHWNGVFKRKKSYKIADLKKESAEKWAKAIFKWSKHYNLPPSELITIAHQETYFRNVIGDVYHKTEDWKPNYSSTIFHMLLQTQQEIFDRMKTRKEKGLPDELPDDLRKFPDLATRIAAYHFKDLVKYADGNYQKARGMWNGGKRNPKWSYIADTNKKEKKLENYLASYKK